MFTYIRTAIAGYDRSLETYIHSFRSAWLTNFFVVITNFMHPIVIVVVSLCFIGMLFSKHLYKELFFFATTIASTQIVVTIIKIIFARLRPLDPLVFESSYSFPSAHSAMSVAFLGSIAYIICKHTESTDIKIACVLGVVFLSLLIGFSRIYLGVHYPSDVIAGWAVGSLILGILIAVFRI